MIQRAAGDVWEHAWQVVDLRHKAPLPEVEALDGVIVSGSPSRIAEPEPWIERGLSYLRELASRGTPTLGICFGHQMLGAALGGQVAPNPRGREIGTVRLAVAETNPLVMPGDAVWVNASHLDSVTELPAGAQSVGRTELERNAVVRFGPSTWGVQFHPEIDGAIMRCYIRERRNALLDEGIEAEALENAAADAPSGRAVIPNFVRNLLG